MSLFTLLMKFFLCFHVALRFKIVVLRGYFDNNKPLGPSSVVKSQHLAAADAHCNLSFNCVTVVFVQLCGSACGWAQGIGQYDQLC